MRPSRVAQGLWLLCATLQLALPSAIAFGEGVLEAQSLRRAGIAHVESHSTPACGHAHPQDCALCRFVSHRVDAGRPVTLVLDVAPQPAQPRALPPHVADAARERLPDSRAPPLLS